VDVQASDFHLDLGGAKPVRRQRLSASILDWLHPRANAGIIADLVFSSQLWLPAHD